MYMDNEYLKNVHNQQIYTYRKNSCMISYCFVKYNSM